MLDNLSTGYSFLINEKVKFINGDLGDEILLDRVFTENQIDAVFHFAANSLVGESVLDPLKYYSNNVQSSITLLKKMVEHGVGKFIFSSTAATYGIPDINVITEKTATNPINPYGHSKLVVEQILATMTPVHNFQFIVLRYFNAAGAHESGEIGESHDPETHLIPIILQHLLGKRKKIFVFGSDYETKDGTCVRDYIHVTDLANAHILAYEGLVDGKVANEIYNLGNGAGYSIKEVIEVCEKVSGKTAVIEFTDRRLGDPAVLVASSAKIEKDLGWKPQFKLDRIVETAWEWHKKGDT